MAADPTDDERTNMRDLKAVLQWAGMDVTHVDDEAQVTGSFLKHLGLKPTAAPRQVGIFEEKDLLAMLEKWKVVDGGTARVPNLGELGSAKLFFRACQLIAGTGKTLEELKNSAASSSHQAPPPQQSQPAATGSPSRKIKLNTVISQVDDSEVLLADEKQILKGFLNYENVFGAGERPPKDCEPTAEQYTAMQHLLQLGSVPYTDFSIFGPFGHRMMKRIKLSGQTLDRDGSLKPIELYGPNNLGLWLQSYNVLLTLLVMLDAVDLGHLQKYRSHVERLAERYGSRVWSVIYQADVRCRLEHMERLKRRLQSEHDKAKASGGSTDFDEKRPWNLVWARAASDETFWREEVNEPCMLILARISNPGEMIEGDARVKAPAPGASQRETTPGPSRMATEVTAPKIRPRNTNRTGRIHNTENGRYTHNRTGFAICSGYNSGTCSETSLGQWCRHNWDTVHQCDRCLGNHQSNKCPHSELQTPAFVRNNAKGKSRGKGSKGGKGGGKRAPY